MSARDRRESSREQLTTGGGHLYQKTTTSSGPLQLFATTTTLLLLLVSESELARSRDLNFSRPASTTPLNGKPACFFYIKLPNNRDDDRASTSKDSAQFTDPPRSENLSANRSQQQQPLGGDHHERWWRWWSCAPRRTREPIWERAASLHLNE